MTKPTYKEFLHTLRETLGARTDVTLAPYAHVIYETPDGSRPYDLMKIASAQIGPTDPIVIIRATIHGDEPGGSYTLMHRIAEIFDYSHARGIKLIVYPMDNPSGFEAGTRYNIENDNGDGGNNDLVRYELEDGTIVGDLGRTNTYIKWYWSSDARFGLKLAKETVALHTELKTLPLAQVKAVVDIHQDDYLLAPGAYHYAFGDVARYRHIAEAIDTFTTVFKNEHIDSGYLAVPGSAEIIEGGKVIPDAFDTVTDDHGFIERHDGTLPDLFDRLGAEHAITIETTTQLPQTIVDAINMAWINGVIDMVAQT